MHGSGGNILCCHPGFLRAAIQRGIIDWQVSTHNQPIYVVSSDAYRNLHQGNARLIRRYVDLLPVGDRDATLCRPHQKPFIGVDIAGD